MRSRRRNIARPQGSHLTRLGPRPSLQREARTKKRTREAPVYDLEEYDGPTWVEPLVRRKRRKRFGLRDIAYVCLLVFLAGSWVWFFLQRNVLKPWIVLGCQSTGICELWQVRASQKFPVLCPWCKYEKADACIVVECVECRKLRYILSYHDTKPCLECGKTSLFTDLCKRCSACRERYFERDGHACPARRRR